MQRHAVHRGGHAVFANAVIDITPSGVVRSESPKIRRQRIVRPRQVGRAAHRLRHHRVDRRQRILGRFAGRDLWPFFRDRPLQFADRCDQPFRRIARDDAVKFLATAGCQFVQPHSPGFVRRRPGRADRAPAFGDIGRHLKRPFGPAINGARRCDFLIAKRRPMRF